MTREQLLSTKNIEAAVDADTVTAMDFCLSAAYQETKNNAQQCEEVFNELDKKAEQVVVDSADTPKYKINNVYTQKLTLDESVEDSASFFKNLSDDSDEDEYLDYDMFDFIYGIVTDDWPRPKNPLNRRIRKFQHTDSDDYIKTNDISGVSQVSTDIRGNIVVFANDPAAFNDVREVCEYYHIKCGQVTHRMSRKSHWKYNMTIFVPMSTEGYPLMVEDFFAKYGLTMKDVIEDHKVGGKVSNWGITYDKKVAKDRKEFQDRNTTEEIFDKYVKAAGSDGTKPLESFMDDMFNELTAAGVSFSKTKLKKRFLDEFNDDFEHDMEEGLLGDTISNISTTIGNVASSLL